MKVIGVTGGVGAGKSEVLGYIAEHWNATPIQGTAADIIKIAMIRVNQALRKENLRSRLVLQVHDELLIETAKEEVEQVSAILEREMRQAAVLSVPLEVDMHTGENWYEAK